MVLFSTQSYCAEEKITYENHIREIFETNCSTCHKPSKRKAGLNLMSYQDVLKGSSSGRVVEPGDVNSPLLKCVLHKVEPFMPPEGEKLKDEEIALIQKWIQGGLLETKTSERAKPVVNASLAMSTASVPKGAVILPQYLNLQPYLETSRANPITALAASPFSPLVAAGGYKQVLLYDTTHLDLLGILPFPEGQICDVKFSRDGSIVLASGGINGKKGSVCLWDVKSGERIFKLENDFDSTLSADVSSDRKYIATGGSDKFVKIYQAKNGSLLHNIKQHSEWITSVTFSPDATLLATGDRNGHIHIWECESGQRKYSFMHHQQTITGLSWRADSHLLASSSEDGEVAIWDMSNGEKAKNFIAHQGGTTQVSYTSSGNLVTCGRDKTIKLYDTNLALLKQTKESSAIILRAVPIQDSNIVVSADFTGTLSLWDLSSASIKAKTATNPLPLSRRLNEAENQTSELEKKTIPLTAEIELLRQKLTPLQASQNKDETAKLSKAIEQKQKLLTQLQETRTQLDQERLRWRAETINQERYKIRDQVAQLMQDAQSQSKIKAEQLKKKEDELFATYLSTLPEIWKPKKIQ